MVFAGNNNNTLVANARTVREFDIQKVNTNFKEAFKCDSKKVVRSANDARFVSVQFFDL